MKKRSRTAAGRSNVSSRSIRLRSAKTSRWGKRCSALKAPTLRSAIARSISEWTCGRARLISLKKKTDRSGPCLSNGPGVDARLTVPGEPGIVEKVVRHEIDGALDTLERAADSARESLEEGGLAYSDIPLQQNVPAREGGDQQQADGPFLADHDSVGTRFEPQRALAPRVKSRSSPSVAGSAEGTRSGSRYASPLPGCTGCRRGRHRERER